MGDRTALLIRCSEDEARHIRAYSQRERRTVSAYVLAIVESNLDIEERLLARLTRFTQLNGVLSRAVIRGVGPRTAVLVRCSVTEAKRIREGARRREMRISCFVLHALRRSWTVDTELRRRKEHAAAANFPQANLSLRPVS
jgi:hypothetical protein